VTRLAEPLGARTLLDVGCGEGIVLRELQSSLVGVRCAAIDVDYAEVLDAVRHAPGCRAQVGSAYEIPYRAGSFDLVVCCEVLEHLERPASALRELVRVSARHVLVSVPREPIWRGLNVIRGAYLRRLGSTPGHVNRWSAASFEALVRSELDVERRATPLPWTLILAKKR
jgi:2-polyprenyl-3-methyl-5-hydroxy-6-metoxy-1,4-benzoquinol methylase